MNPLQLAKIKFAVREATAFVGHSFAEDDAEIVNQLKDFFTKLGVQCDSGKRPEPRPVAEKLLERIRNAELFIGIFTRRDALQDGTFTTSPYTLEEKAAAIAEGKKLLLFVEDGVKDFGGLQGDYEYIRFQRTNFAAALIHAMDYVLAVTSVPLQCRIDGPNKLHFQLGTPTSPQAQIVELRKAKLLHTKNHAVRVSLAKLLEQTEDRSAGIHELRQAIKEFPSVVDVHHEIGHMLERDGKLSDAVLHFQDALDLGPGEQRNFRCYGKCLYKRAKEISESKARKATLQKAGRLLEQAYMMSGDQNRAAVERDLFLVQEELESIDSDGEDNSSTGAA
ncbi:hypothetical protein BH09PLA1_BH09PLA1_24140 [soil metagenome]